MPNLTDLTAAIAEAMRKKDRVPLGALRMLKAAMMNREIERGHPLDEAESQQVVTSLVKQRRDSIEQFTKGGRQELADKEAAEIRASDELSTALAERYGVSVSAVSMVKRGKSWRPPGTANSVFGLGSA